MSIFYEFARFDYTTEHSVIDQADVLKVKHDHSFEVCQPKSAVDLAEIVTLTERMMRVRVCNKEYVHTSRMTTKRKWEWTHRDVPQDKRSQVRRMQAGVGHKRRGRTFRLQWLWMWITLLLGYLKPFLPIFIQTRICVSNVSPSLLNIISFVIGVLTFFSHLEQTFWLTPFKRGGFVDEKSFISLCLLRVYAVLFVSC